MFIKKNFIKNKINDLFFILKRKKYILISRKSIYNF